MSLIPIQSFFDEPMMINPWGMQPSVNVLDDVHHQMNRLNRMAHQLSNDMVQQGMTLEGASVRNDKNTFQLKMDVRHYKPEEIEIKQEGNMVTVVGKHEERQDENNMYVSRQFSRRYTVPEDVDITKMDAKFTKNGTLTVVAPKLAIEAPKETPIAIKRG